MDTNQHDFYTGEEFDNAAHAATQSLAARAAPKDVLRMLHDEIGGAPYGTWTIKNDAQRYAIALQKDWATFCMQHFDKLDSEAIRLHYDNAAKTQKTRENARALFVSRLIGEKLVSGQERAKRQKVLSTTHIEGGEAMNETTVSEEAAKLTSEEANLLGWFKSLNRGNKAIVDAALAAYDEGDSFELSIKVTPAYSPDDVAADVVSKMKGKP
jgi:hypothetical protein